LICQGRVFILIPSRNKFGYAALNDESRSLLVQSFHTVPHCKELNELELMRVLFELKKSPSLKMPRIELVFGSEMKVAIDLARSSMGQNGALLSIADSAIESRLCRENQSYSSPSYGEKMHFRKSIKKEFNEVTVTGEMIFHGEKYMLVVGGLYLHIKDDEIDRFLIRGRTSRDFLWANRPHVGDLRGNASRTRGLLQYTITLKGDFIFISGFKVPMISKEDAQMVDGSGEIPEKSQEKKDLDLLKRKKNRYWLLGNN
jgi:hypothetical protein